VHHETALDSSSISSTAPLPLPYDWQHHFGWPRQSTRANQCFCEKTTEKKDESNLELFAYQLLSDDLSYFPA
jgi:hypothetical protein